MTAMSEVEQLERQFDGSIPRRLRQAAERRDAQRAYREAPLGLAPRPTRTKPAREMIAGMAEVMVLRATVDNACCDTDLTAAGYSLAQQSLYGEAARELAARLMDARAA